jgi:hypothetical protein
MFVCIPHLMVMLASTTYHMLFMYSIFHGGPGSSVGIATGYRQDSPGIESLWGRDFLHMSRPALGPPNPLYNGYWVFQGVKRPGRGDDHPSPPGAKVKNE